MCVADKGCVVHKELWFYLMYYSRDIMKRKTPKSWKRMRMRSIYLFTIADTPALTTFVAFLKAPPVPGIGTPVGLCGVPSG
jgi:hypothetical protein